MPTYERRVNRRVGRGLPRAAQGPLRVLTTLSWTLLSGMETGNMVSAQLFPKRGFINLVSMLIQWIVMLLT